MQISWYWSPQNYTPFFKITFELERGDELTVPLVLRDVSKARKHVYKRRVPDVVLEFFNTYKKYSAMFTAKWKY